MADCCPIALDRGVSGRISGVDPYRPFFKNVRSAAEVLLIKVALASGKIEIVTMAETFQDRLDVSGELQGLK